MNKFHYLTLGSLMLLSVLLLVLACTESPVAAYPVVTRESKLPADIVKRTPETDQHPPILHSNEYNNPVPLASIINTSGAEDSPFITANGDTLYFFFTPDVRVPANQQLFDDVTGIWVCRRSGDSWTVPQRVWLQDPGKLALDGAVCVQGNEMWFCSAREGYTGVNMFTAAKVNGIWKNWQYCGDRLMQEIKIGEVHIHGDDLYFHSDRAGGLGNYDIWKTTRSGSTWSDPIHLQNVNTTELDGYPYISSDGSELWFTRTYLGTPAIFRSKLVGGNWSNPELMISQFAGEPTLDDAGNLYFVHHFYENNVMIEADIYLATPKSRK
jgi:hypothetical protein